MNNIGGDMNKEEQMIDGKIILTRQKTAVIINSETKTVEFSQLEYTFDEVLQVAREIAETF